MSEAEEWHWNSFMERARWDLRFCWWPQKCRFSDRWIWLETAYRGEAIWTGPGESIAEIHWAEPGEYLIARIKGEVK